MYQKTDAIVIKSVKYSESSLIVNCYCKDFGLKSFFLRGILKTKVKQNIKKALFEPLNLLEIVFANKLSNRLGYIKEAKLKYPYNSIPFNFDKKSAIFFLTELLYEVLQEDKNKNKKLYKYIYNSMIWLDSNEKIGNFLIKFMFDLTKFLGFQPNIENENFSFFDLENGCTTNKKPNGKFLEGKLKNTMIWFLGINFDDLNSIKLNKIEKSKLINHALDYFQLHLQHFIKPKSISIINEIYRSI